MLQNGVQSTVAQELKQRTAENHTLLEEALLPKLYAIRTTADYIKILTCFYGFFRPVEMAIERHIQNVHLPDIHLRRKAHYILDDLASFSYPTHSIPFYEAIPVITTWEQAFGALYVLEGSTLGGRGITRLLLKNEEVPLGNNALTFFNGYGEGTGTMWLQFQQSLQRNIREEKQLTKTIETANKTFITFKEWIDKTIP